MREPSVRTSRIAIATGVAAFLAAAGGGFVLGRATAPRLKASAPAVAPVQPPGGLKADEPPRIWGRAEILDLGASAADAFASGNPPPEDSAAAVGQRFNLSLPFGCARPSAEGSKAAMRWRYDEEEGVLRIRVTPVTWAGADWGLAYQGRSQSSQGFWITRPWSSSEDCPLQDANEEDVAPPEHTLALAQFERSNGTDRWLKDRRFEKILRIASEDFDASRGFRLRLIGRIDHVPGEGPVQCRQPLGAGQRPVCVLSVMLREIRLENPADDAPLAIWENRSIIGAAKD